MASGLRRLARLGQTRYALESEVARGGMGVVYRGRRLRDDRAVALKVVLPKFAEQRAHREGFWREIEAMARLEHPHIVQIFDVGELDLELGGEGESQGSSPCLVMEWVEQGSLRRSGDVDSFEGLAQAVRQILEAMAHAHARGVIHRDLKTQNVLKRSVGSGEESGEGAGLDLVLTDFGLAQLRREDRLERPGFVTGGTLPYMPPEQLEGRWRDFGPSSDVYALGCLAFDLLTGRPPWLVVDLERRERRWDPQLQGRFAFPEEFGRWFARATDPDPRRRFDFAADALAAFEAMGRAGSSALVVPQEVGQEPSQADSMTWSFEEGSLGVTAGWGGDTDDHTVGAWSPEAMSLPSSSVWAQGPQSEPAQAPASAEGTAQGQEASEVGEWQEGPRLELPRRLPAAPVVRREDEPGLFGLRRLPFLERLEEDQLWNVLRRVSETGRGEAILLEGPAGVGKSQVVRRLMEAAHELGAARGVVVRHNPKPGRLPPFDAALGRLLGVQGLRGDELIERLKSLELPGLRDVPTLLVAAQLLDASVVEQRQPLTTRYEMRHRLLAALSDRPLILWLDDAHRSDDTLDFVARTLEAPVTEQLPVMIVFSAGREELDEASTRNVALRGVMSQHGLRHVGLELLHGAPLRRMLRDQLGLGEALAWRVEEVCGGSPLFASVLVGGWVERGMLRRDAQQRWELTQATETLPVSFEQLWEWRVESALEVLGRGRRKVALEALVCAAQLGEHVDELLWLDACGRAEISAPHRLVEEMLRRGLARGWVGGFSFIHKSLGEYLRGIELAPARRRAVHLACARALQARGGREVRRLAWHLLEAGESQEAMDLLWSRLKVGRPISDSLETRLVIGMLDEALERQGRTLEDAQRSRLQLLRAEMRYSIGEAVEASEDVLRVKRRALHFDWPVLLSEAIVVEGELVAFGRDYPSALSAMNKLRWVLSQSMEREEQRWKIVRLGAMVVLGELCCLFERNQEARLLTDQAQDLAEELGDEERSLWAQQSRASIELQLATTVEELDEVEAKMRRVLSEFEARRAYHGMALVHYLLGAIMTSRGDAEGALRCYELAAAWTGPIPSSERPVVRCHLALVYAQHGRYEEALGFFEAAMLEFARLQTHAMTLVATLGYRLCFAFARGPWTYFAEAVQWVFENGGASNWGLSELENLAFLAEVGAHLSAERADGEGVRLGVELACWARTSLGQLEEVMRIEEWRASIDDRGLL